MLSWAAGEGGKIMTKRIVILLLMVGLIGCEAKVQMRVESKPSEASTVSAMLPSPTPTPAPLTDAQKFSLLRQEAHKRGLKWHIFCIGDDFMGEAVLKERPWADFYIEDGAKGDWLETGRTQVEVAYKLYQSIQQSQTHPPRHKRPEDEHRKVCPPELRGD